MKYIIFQKANQIHTIQQLNIYPNGLLIKIMLEIQQSVSF